MTPGRLLLAAAAATAACDAGLAPGGPWVPWQEIEGPLRPQVVQPPAPAEVGRPLRMVTFNVEYGERPAALAEALRALEGDLVLVQEIEHHPDEGEARAAALADALEMGYAYAPSRELERGGTHGLAILSRYPLAAVEVMELPRADLAYHPRRRIALAAEIQIAEQTLKIVNLHLDTRLNLRDRILQLRPAALDQPDPIAIGGDFNMNPYTWAEGTVPLPPAGASADTDQAAAIDAYMRELDFRAPTADVGPTQRSGPLRLRLDAIYLRGLRARDAGVERSIDLSDHWPLWIELSPDGVQISHTAHQRKDRL